MRNADKSAMPIYDVIEDCGIDGSKGPYLVTQVDTGLTKREHIAAMAMQGFCAAPGAEDWAIDDLAEIAVRQADALLAELERTGGES